jgi:hypothetical protein
MAEQFEIGQSVRIGTPDAFGGKVGTVEQVQPQDYGAALVWVQVPGFANTMPFGADELAIVVPGPDLPGPDLVYRPE